MQKNLWGRNFSTKDITINVYHDERKLSKKWLYHSFLFIPISNEDEVLKLLNDARVKSGWEKELHFKNLRDTNTQNHLALNWICLFGQSLFEKIYFYFLGVDYHNLEKELWENKSQRHFKIYNRFFQIGLYGAIKWFFLDGNAKFEKVYIEKIFSDKKSRELVDRFHSQPIEDIKWKSLIKGENISFKTSKIIEIDSNHKIENRYPEKSHFIQFVDLIMGTFSQIFDDTSVQKGKCMTVDKCLKFELPAKLMRYNKNSRYYKKYTISFFPKKKLTKKEILEGSITRRVDLFYNKRTMKYTNRNQLSLFN